VDFGRANFLLPVPKVSSLVELNEMLDERCRTDLQRQLWGKNGTKEVLLTEERAAFLPLPAQECEARRVTQANANSLSLVQFDTNRYSVPVKYAHRKITVVATVDDVKLVFEDRLIARQRRHWGRKEYFYDPIHYLSLLERKPGVFDYARPLADWQLPGCLNVLRRRMECAPDGLGTKEFIQGLLLLEKETLGCPWKKPSVAPCPRTRANKALLSDSPKSRGFWGSPIASCGGRLVPQSARHGGGRRARESRASRAGGRRPGRGR